MSSKIEDIEREDWNNDKIWETWTPNKKMLLMMLQGLDLHDDAEDAWMMEKRVIINITRCQPWKNKSTNMLKKTKVMLSWNPSCFTLCQVASLFNFWHICIEQSLFLSYWTKMYIKYW